MVTSVSETDDSVWGFTSANFANCHTVMEDVVCIFCVMSYRNNRKGLARFFMRADHFLLKCLDWMNDRSKILM